MLVQKTLVESFYSQLFFSWYIESLITIFCDMNYSAYPLDVQLCTFKMTSSNLQESELRMNGNSDYTASKQRPLGYQVNS
jgi:hypothetical protein